MVRHLPGKHEDWRSDLGQLDQKPSGITYLISARHRPELELAGQLVYTDG